MLKYPGRVGEVWDMYIATIVFDSDMKAAIYGAGCWANRDKASRDQPRGIACSVSGANQSTRIQILTVY